MIFSTFEMLGTITTQTRWWWALRGKCSRNLCQSGHQPFAATSFPKNFWETQPLKVYDFKRSKDLLSRLGIELSRKPSFDSRLAKYLLLEPLINNEIVTIAGLYGTPNSPKMRRFMGKALKRACLKSYFIEPFSRQKSQFSLKREKPMTDLLSQHWPA